MKIIFLDIDGVLNSEKWYIEIFDKNLYPNLENYPLCEFDPLAIEQLNLLTDKTNAKIVISSTWRMGRTIDELKNIFARIREATEHPFVFEETEIPIAVSIGEAIYPDDGENMDELIRLADKRMYQEKQLKSDHDIS